MPAQQFRPIFWYDRLRDRGLANELVKVHSGSFPPKRATTAAVAVPQLLFGKADPEPLPRPYCLGCIAETSPSKSDSASGDSSDSRLRPHPHLTDRHLETLTYGRGLSLRLLLFLLRWARPYAGVPSDFTYRRTVFNGTQPYTLSELAGHIGLKGPEGIRAVRNAYERLEDLRLLAVVQMPGKKSYFVPHTTGSPVYLPQWLWDSGTLANRKLTGTALWLLIRMLATVRTGKPPRGGGQLADLMRRAWELGFVLDTSVVDTLPVSTTKRRQALSNLAAYGPVIGWAYGSDEYLIVGRATKISDKRWDATGRGSR